MQQNNKIAFTTIPVKGEEHIKVAHGVVHKSAVRIDEIKDKFLAKIPDYIMGIPEILSQLELFEISFEKASVVVDFQHIGTTTI